MSEDKSSTRLSKLSKQIEMIGMEIKDLNEQTETGRLGLFISKSIIDAHAGKIWGKK